MSGGLAFDLSPTSLVYGSFARNRTEFTNAFEDGIDLGDSLNRDRDDYQAGVKTDLTPLLSVQVYGNRQQDIFKSDPLRNATSTAGLATFRIAADAVVTGIVTVGYRDMQPVDPETKPFRGFIGSAAITYPLLEIGRFIFQLSRGNEYSFDAAEAYYVENAGALSLHAAAVRRRRHAGTPGAIGLRLQRPDRHAAPDGHLDTAAGSLGYNLRNRTRSRR